MHTSYKNHDNTMQKTYQKNLSKQSNQQITKYLGRWEDGHMAYIQ